MSQQAHRLGLVSLFQHTQTFTFTTKMPQQSVDEPAVKHGVVFEFPLVQRVPLLGMLTQPILKIENCPAGHQVRTASSQPFAIDSACRRSDVPEKVWSAFGKSWRSRFGCFIANLHGSSRPE